MLLKFSTNVCLGIILFSLFIICVKSNPQSSTNDEVKKEDKNVYLDIKSFVEDAIDWAQKISLVWLSKFHKRRADVTEIVPFTLFPSPFPREMFEFGQQMQKAYNLLYFRVSNDYEFLEKAYEKVVKTNVAIRRLMDILKAVNGEGIKQTKSLLLARSDYMCHVLNEGEISGHKYGIKQIEFNAGQIGGLSVSRRITNLHRRTMWKAGRKWTQNEMPNSEGDKSVADALYQAWQSFGDPKAIILIVANKRSLNRIGQRHIEYELAKLTNKKVKVTRIGEPERAALAKKGRLFLAPDYSLIMEGKKIAVIYQVTDPHEDEQNADEAAAQLLIERSTAIKSPTVGLNLASQKRVQMLLAKPGMLEKFLPEPEYAEMIANLRSTFAGLWDLDDDDEHTKLAIKDAIENPENYVLKPNMEGGGNNIWGEKIREKLQTFTHEQRAAHILMKKVQPIFVIKNYMVRSQQTKPQYGRMTSELSIIGWLLGDAKGNRVMNNVQKGHFMRTKLEKVNEGGISVGTGAFDSPYLI